MRWLSFLIVGLVGAAWGGSFPIRGWGVHRVEPTYLRYVIERAPEFGVNHIQLPHAFSKHGVQLPESDEHTKLLRDIASYAHDKGVELFPWVREVGELPQEVKREFIFDGRLIMDAKFYDWTEQKYNTLFSLLPEIDGVILTLRESNRPPQDDARIFSPLPKYERIHLLIESIWNACKKHNKSLYVRTFAVYPGEADNIIRGIRLSPQAVGVMTKCEARDWHGYLPNHPAIGKFGDRRQIIEFDLAGEYFGQAIIPYCTPEYIKERWLYAVKHGADGAVGRIDRHSNPALDTLNEINIYTLSHLLQDPRADTESIWHDYVTRKYGEKAAPFVISAMKKTKEILDKVYLIKHFKFLNEHSSVPTVGYAESHITSASLAIWIPEEKELEQRLLHPDGELFHEILEEKDEAIKLAKEALSDIKKAKPYLNEKDYQYLYSQFKKELDVAKLWRYLAEAFYSYMLYKETGDKIWQSRAGRICSELEQYKEYLVKEYGKNFYLGPRENPRAFVIPRVQEFVDEIRAKVGLRRCDG